MHTKHPDPTAKTPSAQATLIQAPSIQTTLPQATPLRPTHIQPASIHDGPASLDHRFSTKELILGGMFAAVMTIISQLSIPMPTGVPITIQLFGVTLIGVVLGWRLGLLAMVTYILLGAAGLPVFSNFRGGLGVLTGVTGGYLWSYPLLVALCGIRPRTGNLHFDTLLTILLALLGLAVAETIGGLQWAVLAGDQSVGAVFAYSIVAFIPKDILLTILAVLVGVPMRKALKSA